jgi:S1/P1 Nuclease
MLENTERIYWRRNMPVTKRFAMALSWLALSSVPALSWNGFGHMEVAAVAWDALSDKPQIQARITDLLKRNPLYKSWTNDVDDELREKVGFMKAATWADIIKGDHTYISDGAPGSGGNRPTGTPDDSLNIGYSDKRMHKYWHFIDKPFSPDHTRLEQPPEPNIQDRIATFRKALAPDSGIDDGVRSYDLTWLLHLVGDAHQPLHATSRFTQVDPHGDDGGNAEKIECGKRDEVFCRNGSKLHAFWDDLLGPDNGTPDRVIHAQGGLPVPDRTLASKTDAADWLDESFKIAEAVAYADPPISTGGGTITLTDTYKRKAMSTAEERIALAGVRLAALLEAALR